MKSATATVAVTLAAATLLACGDSPVATHVEPKPEPSVGPNGGPPLTLSADSVAVGVGDGSLLTATIRDAAGPVQYLSRDQNVATVNADGAVRAVGTGSTYVVATLSDRPDARDSVRVRVHTLPIAGDPCPASRPPFGPTFGSGFGSTFVATGCSPHARNVAAANVTATVAVADFMHALQGRSTGAVIERVSGAAEGRLLKSARGRRRRPHAWVKPAMPARSFGTAGYVRSASAARKVDQPEAARRRIRNDGDRVHGPSLQVERGRATGDDGFMTMQDRECSRATRGGAERRW